MDTTEILVILTVTAGAFIQGFSGFGFALFSLPILSFLIGIKTAVPLIALCGLTNNIFLVIDLKQHIKPFELKRLITGAVIGIPLGAIFLSKADPDLLKTLLGILVIIFVLLSLFQLIKPRGVNKNYGYLFGLMSGLLGGAFNTNGPPILIYFYLQGWDKFKQKASITGFFIVTSLVIVITHSITGVINMSVLSYFVYSALGVILGSYLGVKLFNKVSTKVFNKILLYGLLVISFFLIFR